MAQHCKGMDRVKGHQTPCARRAREVIGRLHGSLASFTNCISFADEDMNKLILSNVSVEFPFRPYPCQVVYMEKVILALQQASTARLCSHFNL